MAGTYGDKIAAIQRVYAAEIAGRRAGKVQDGIDVAVEGMRVAMQFLDTTMKWPSMRSFDLAAYRKRAAENMRDLADRTRAIQHALHSARFVTSDALQAVDNTMTEKIEAVRQDAAAALRAQMDSLR